MNQSKAFFSRQPARQRIGERETSESFHNFSFNLLGFIKTEVDHETLL